MVIYNITTKVTWAVADAWVQWMQETHLPHMTATGYFSTHQLARLLDVDDAEGPTFALQLTADSKEQLDAYIHEHAPALRQEAFDKWGDQFIAFRSIMQVVS